MTKLFGAVEGGGTKFVCAVGAGPQDRLRTERIATTTPDETLARVRQFLVETAAHAKQPLAAVGIATFGPIELDPKSDHYGCMLPTTKPGWSGAPIVAPLTGGLDLPVGLDTDVNGAALGEYSWGAAQGCDPTVYLTVGTGIGGGAVVGGQPLHGLLHPEMGHVRVPRARDTAGRLDPFPGICPFHGDCLEGLASGPALAARTGRAASDLAADDPVWHLEAAYLAAALAHYVLILSPQCVVVGGGVLEQPHLLPRVRRELRRLLGNYIPRTQVAAGLDRYVVAPYWGAEAGLAGAFVLAEQAAAASTVADQQTPR